MATNTTYRDFLASLTSDELSFLAAAHDRYDLGETWCVRLYLETGVHPQTLRKVSREGDSYYPPPFELTQALCEVRADLGSGPWRTTAPSGLATSVSTQAVMLPAC